MRVKIAGPINVRKGQKAHIYTSLRKDQPFALISVFSSVNGFEPSPHVEETKLDLKRSKRPQMVTPVTIRLTASLRPNAEIELPISEQCEIYLFQDVDSIEETQAIGRVYTNAKGFRSIFLYTRRWLDRNKRW